MTTTGNVDYTNVYYKYKNSTPINDKPAHKTLKWLNNKLSENGSSVNADLRGDHGYFGLVLDDVDDVCIMLTPLPFVATYFSGPLVLDPAHTAL